MRMNGFGFETKPEAAASGDELVAGVAAVPSRPASTAFGAARCMFESNFPVDKGFLQLPGVLERLQARGIRLFRRREDGTVQPDRDHRLSARPPGCERKL